MKKTIYALIVGINNYPTNKLRGCINDALDVKDFLDDLEKNNDSIESINYKYLLSPLEDDIKALEAAGLTKGTYDAPTRDNIIKGFGHFKNAKPENGDSCLFYYIGHGSFQPAPKVFWHMKSARQLETIVCEDSRSGNGRDLVDKELAYLIWDVMKGKEEMHFLAIMDSCHSGDGTRSMNQNIKARQDIPNRNKLELNDLVGYQSARSYDRNSSGDFYFYLDANQEKLDTKIGRHVHLAAALESQSAKELSIDGKRRGIFTYSLFKTLRNGGTNLSYDELIPRINDYIKNHVRDQYASSFSDHKEDKALKFLGEKIGYESPEEEFAVVYSEKEGSKEWKLLAGKMHGIAPSIEGMKSLVRIMDGHQNDRIVEIKKVKGDYAILDATLFNDDDKESILKATIESMPRPKIRIGYAPDLSDENKAKIEKVYKVRQKENSIHYFEINEENCSYEIHEEKEHYFLTRLGENAPLFQRQNHVSNLFVGLESIGKWISVLNLGENNKALLKRKDVDIEILIYEGMESNVDALEEYTPTRILKNPEEINLNYVEGEYEDGEKFMAIPGIAIKISSARKQLSYQAYTMTNEFGITNLLSTSEMIDADGDGEYLKIKYDVHGNSSTIYYGLEESYPSRGIFEVTDYLKFFISIKPIAIDYKQNSLPVDSGFSNLKVNMPVFRKTLENWMAFRIPVNIKHPMPSELVETKVDKDNSRLARGVRLLVPDSFSAKVTLASKKNIEEAIDAMKEDTRSFDETKKTNFNAAFLPPSHIWGNCESDSHVITDRGAASSSDSNLSVLEIEVLQGGDSINDENHIVLETPVHLAKDESIIPFAFDKESGLYLPFGYTNEEGNIIINNLPEPTEGKIYSEGAISTRSLGGSIKLFLKKIIWSPRELNQLKKVALVEGKVQSTKVEKGELTAGSTGEIALLIHGIIGDTEAQVNGLFNKTELYQKFGMILTYDYENLSTPIDEIAGFLKEKLEHAGLFESKKRKLTIIAHSMGGLVSRHFMEDKELNGVSVVKKLIQLGTPNGGSELSDVRKFLATTLAWGMNGIAPIKPYMPVISFVSKFIGSKVFKTLNQMSPTKSDFIKDLNKDSKVGEIPYFIIAGDTSRIDSGYMEDDPFWTQFKKAIKNKGKYAVLDKLVFPSKNDMCVTIKSMQTIPNFNIENMAEIPGDHITYFENDAALELLEKYIDA